MKWPKMAVTEIDHDFGYTNAKIAHLFFPIEMGHLFRYFQMGYFDTGTAIEKRRANSKRAHFGRRKT